jgi:hypothetical protein
MTPTTETLDRIAETSVAHRCNVLRACKASLSGDTALLRVLASEHEIDANIGELRRAAREFLSMYSKSVRDP